MLLEPGSLLKRSLSSMTVALLSYGASAMPAPPDLFEHLISANEAQIVMLEEEKLIDRSTARKIAQALEQYAQAQAAPGSARDPDYLVLEAALAERIGAIASNLHLGRSRNDLGAAMNRMALRDGLLRTLGALGDVRRTVHGIAAEHVETIVPGFTHAVQAQPTTLAHFLLAFDGALARDAARLREAYARTNTSPLGAAAITTSGFALNRERLAELLSFRGLVENSYDAIVVSTADSKIEIASALSLSAIGIGRLAQDFLFQYDDPAPSIMVRSDVSGRSSIMPQKRNPSMIEMLRVHASEVVADSHKATIYAHNTPLHEVRDIRRYLFDVVQGVLGSAETMYRHLATVLGSLDFRVAALRERVDNDYSTMTEVADALYRDTGVPFRNGYRFASALTNFGRERNKRPADIAYGEAVEVYAAALDGQRLPLDEAKYRAAIDAAAIVADRKGRGGPQRAEVERMLAEAIAGNEADAAWIAAERQRFASVAAERVRLFEGLGGAR